MNRKDVRIKQLLDPREKLTLERIQSILGLESQKDDDMCDCPACGGTGWERGYGSDNPEYRCIICQGSGELNYDVGSLIRNLQAEILALRNEIGKLLEEVR